MLVEQSSMHIIFLARKRRALSQRKIRAYRIRGRSSPSVPEHGETQAQCPSTSANWGLMRIIALKREKVRFRFDRGQSSREDDDGLLTGWWLYRMLTGGRTEVGQGLRGAARNVDQLCIRAPESDMRSGRSRRWRQMQERARGDRC
jgi:hypothetical protein